MGKGEGSVLAGINSPADLRRVPPDDLPVLCDEIRAFLVDRVSRTGGHLGPNLGVVELTIALHRVFESPTDVILWDTGHQAYVHKMLTGRRDDFVSLRQENCKVCWFICWKTILEYIQSLAAQYNRGEIDFLYGLCT